jgi:hypothetical protein
MHESPRITLHNTLNKLHRVFKRAFRGLVSEDPGQVYLQRCYRLLSRLSVLNEKLMLASGYCKGGA